MGKHKPPVEKLARLTLKLIERDLKRIAGMIADKPPGEYDLVLTRYFTAIMGQKKLSDKIDDEIRKKLKGKSQRELEELVREGTDGVPGKGPPK